MGARFEGFKGLTPSVLFQLDLLNISKGHFTEEHELGVGSGTVMHALGKHVRKVDALHRKNQENENLHAGIKSTLEDPPSQKGFH